LITFFKIFDDASIAIAGILEQGTAYIAKDTDSSTVVLLYAKEIQQKSKL
jgi:hypothetical protein